MPMLVDRRIIALRVGQDEVSMLSRLGNVIMLHFAGRKGRGATGTWRAKDVHAKDVHAKEG